MAISTLENPIGSSPTAHHYTIAFSRRSRGADYARIQKHLHMNTGVTGRTLQEHGTPVTEVYFPNGGVFSVTNEMRDGALVEVATVGIEGMLGIGVFLGDRSGASRIFQ
jgi:hypothetical protein